jgi:hypothetical protein
VGVGEVDPASTEIECPQSVPPPAEGGQSRRRAVRAYVLADGEEKLADPVSGR